MIRLLDRAGAGEVNAQPFVLAAEYCGNYLFPIWAEVSRFNFRRISHHFYQ